MGDVHEQEVAALRNEVAAEKDEVNKLHTGDLPADVLAKYAKASSSTVLDFKELCYMAILTRALSQWYLQVGSSEASPCFCLF